MLFALAAPRESIVVIEGIDEGKKVGGVVREAAEVQTEFGQQMFRQIGFNTLNSVGINSLHVVPETLAGQQLGWRRTESCQRGAGIPLGKGALAFGCRAAIDGCQGEVLTDGKPLFSFGQMLIDDLHETQALGHRPSSGHSTEAEHSNLLGFYGSAMEFDGRDDVVGRAEVFLHRQARFAIDAPGLNSVVISMPLDRAASNGRHELYNTLLSQIVNK